MQATPPLAVVRKARSARLCVVARPGGRLTGWRMAVVTAGGLAVEATVGLAVEAAVGLTVEVGLDARQALPAYEFYIYHRLVEDAFRDLQSLSDGVPPHCLQEVGCNRRTV